MVLFNKKNFKANQSRSDEGSRREHHRFGAILRPSSPTVGRMMMMLIGFFEKTLSSRKQTLVCACAASLLGTGCNCNLPRPKCHDISHTFVFVWWLLARMISPARGAAGWIPILVAFTQMADKNGIFADSLLAIYSIGHARLDFGVVYRKS